MKKTYHSLVQTGREFHPHKDQAEAHETLMPGAYFVKYNPNTGQMWFEEFKATCDNIIDLPSKEYTKVVGQMQHFLNPTTRAKFEEKGFLYKRSAILHGLPGTGKSVIINRVMREVVKSGGVVLFVEHPGIIKMAFNVLDDLQKDIVTLVVFEEIDGIINNYGESHLLSILDGEIQKENVMYLAATNYIDKIPKRLLRPGRFSSVIEVGYPSEDARRVYFEHKMGKDFVDLNRWVRYTDGLSVDELKEVVQSVYIFNDTLEETVTRLKSLKGIEVNEDDFYEEKDVFFGDEEEDDEKDQLSNDLRLSSAKKHLWSR